MTRDSGFIDVASQHRWRSLEEEVRPVRFDYFIYHTDVPNIPVYYRFQFTDFSPRRGHADRTGQRMTQHKPIKRSYVASTVLGTAPSISGRR